MDLIISLQSELVSASFGGRTCQVAIGRSGIGQKVGEGDGVSPLGCWPIRKVYYRADRILHEVPWQGRALAIQPQDGWCDDPRDPNYNSLVEKPFAASHEDMWREDGLYDVVVVLGFNDQPVVAGAGSAIFLHVARPGYAPTEGCAALSLPDLLEYLAQADLNSKVCFMGASDGCSS